MTAEFWFYSDNFEILNLRTSLLWKLKKSISQILSVILTRVVMTSILEPNFNPLLEFKLDSFSAAAQNFF
jgi:hypothetical protein